MRSVFHPESLIWKPLGVLGDFVMLSLLWAVCSVPIVTLGPASAALYDAAVHGMRRKDDPLISRFIETFRRELREGVLSTLIWAAIALGLFLVIWTAAACVPACQALVLLLGLLLAFFLLCVQCWVWPTLSRFTLGLRALHQTALRLAFGHILRSAAMALLWGAALWFGLRYILPLFAAPGLAAWLSTWLIEPVFLAYENPDGDPAGDRETG